MKEFSLSALGPPAWHVPVRCLQQFRVYSGRHQRFVATPDALPIQTPSCQLEERARKRPFTLLSLAAAPRCKVAAATFCAPASSRCNCKPPNRRSIGNLRTTTAVNTRRRPCWQTGLMAPDITAQVDGGAGRRNPQCYHHAVCRLTFQPCSGILANALRCRVAVGALLLAEAHNCSHAKQEEVKGVHYDDPLAEQSERVSESGIRTWRHRSQSCCMPKRLHLQLPSDCAAS